VLQCAATSPEYASSFGSASPKLIEYVCTGWSCSLAVSAVTRLESTPPDSRTAAGSP
jgi:hypothetical protein